MKISIWYPQYMKIAFRVTVAFCLCSRVSDKKCCYIFLSFIVLGKDCNLKLYLVMRKYNHKVVQELSCKILE